MSLQVCHCGWSKVTSYHGLRTHQGKMGCTPRGLRIPQSQQLDHYPGYAYVGPPVEVQEPLWFEDVIRIRTGGMSVQRCSCGWSTWGTSSHLKTHQDSTDCTARGPKIRELEQTRPVPMLPAPPVTTHSSPPAPTVRDTTVAAFETPPASPQTGRSSAGVRRVLDFLTGGQQLDTWVHPAAAAQDRRVQQMDREQDEKRKKEKKRQKEIKDRKKAEFQLKIRIAEHKILEVQSSAGVCEDCLDAEMLQIDDVFSELIRLVEEARRKALRPLKERKEEVRREAEDVVKDLQREIQIYEGAIQDVDGDLPASSLPSGGRHRDRRHTSVDTSLSFSTLRATTSAMIRQIEQEVENLTPVEMKRILTFAVDVRLDPTTAHRSLLLSADGKEVRGGDDGNGPEGPASAAASGGFDMFGSVLGQRGVASGRAYWEVEVGNKSGWDLGVTRRGANRKGRLALDPDNGYWVLVHYEGRKYAAMTAPPASLRVTDGLSRVGVFLDHQEGVVSFYDVTAGSHIYSFTECSFRDEILPYFSPHQTQQGTNAAPLIISEPRLQ